MAEWKWTERPLPVSLGRLGSAVVAADRLYLVRHADLATFRVDGDSAEVWHEPLSVRTRIFLDDRNMQVTVDERGVLYALLVDGSVWRYERGGELQAISRPDLRTAGHYAHRTGFVWDSVDKSLVVTGGDDRNDAYVLGGGGEFVPLPHGPGHGVGQTVATPHGVYRMVGQDLWLLRERSWALVGRHDRGRRDHGALLYWDPALDLLFFVSQSLDFREPPVRVQWRLDGPSAPLRLPGSFEGPLAAHESVAEIDPLTGRLWMVDHFGARFLELDDLKLTKGSPTEPMPHARKVVSAPPTNWYREAIALKQHDEEEADPLPVPVRDGWVLAACLPISPYLPLDEAGSVLLFAREAPDEHDPWTLGFNNAFEVRIVEETLPLMAGGRRLDETKYLEVDPVLAARADTICDGSPYLARGSKIGGFPSLVQGAKEEVANGFVADLKCEDCEARLRFVAQLTWPEFDLISAVVHIYACPYGHSAAARAQNV